MTVCVGLIQVYVSCWQQASTFFTRKSAKEEFAGFASEYRSFGVRRRKRTVQKDGSSLFG